MMRRCGHIWIIIVPPLNKNAARELDIVLTPDGKDIEAPEIAYFLDDAEACANYYVPSDR